MALDLTTLSQKEKSRFATYIKTCELVKKDNQTLMASYTECRNASASDDHSLTVIAGIAAFAAGLFLGNQVMR